MERTHTHEVRTMFPDDVKEFMEQSREGTYTLLDVRQPPEYEQAHLPGATLVPLPRLADSLGELDRRQPTLVYCQVGGRSQAAAQLLASQGFEEVYQVMGGIEAWEGLTAEGPVAFHLEFMRGDETPHEMIVTAYRMEEGLKRFHQTVRERASDPEVVELLGHLMRAEESHQRTLADLHGSWAGTAEEAELRAAAEESLTMEGGVEIDRFLERNQRFLGTVRGVLQVAMMIETQALDLYLRMAGASTHPGTREVLLRVGEEEKAHLAALGRLLEEKL